MQIRQFLNRNPAIAIAAVLVVIVVCIYVVWSSTKTTAVATPTQAYFTTDDGKTWFVDDIARIAPFDKDGKQAVRAYLFKCGSGDPVVGYVERYSAKGKEVVERYRAEQKAKPGVPPASLGEFAALGQGATEVKKPGDSKWVNNRDGAAVGIKQFKCPDGTPGVVMQ